MLVRIGNRIDLARLDRISPLAAPLFLEPGKVPIHGAGRERLAEDQARALMQAAGLA
jgi:ATP-dependent Lhr-like helicase